MLRCIKIKAYQTYANYKKPMAIEVAETYSLPPPSTVIGMIHNICGFTNYHPLKVAIQGERESLARDMYTRYFFGTSYEAGRHQFKVANAKGGYDGITRGLGNNILLIGMNLLIYILPEKAEEFDVIYDKLQKPDVYPSLGRHEDLLRIDEVSAIEIERTDSVLFEYDAYVAVDAMDEPLTYAAHNLNKIYTIDPADNTRAWQRVRCYQVPKDTIFAVKENAYAYKEAGTNKGVFFI